ncbi:helix-turn-helix transcriptional regulator [Bradyrhizobium sp. 186]|nr:helix-turn-helix transcriptional regulator [Bradyrhizobium sp. 186]
MHCPRHACAGYWRKSKPNTLANLSLAELANESGYSRAHFLRMFRAATGKTPHQYLLHVRLERAREQFQTGLASILEIALATGFASHSHLTRQFRQRFGHNARFISQNRIALFVPD